MTVIGVVSVVVGLVGGALVWPFARGYQQSIHARRDAVRDGPARNDRARTEATARFYETTARLIERDGGGRPPR